MENNSDSGSSSAKRWKFRILGFLLIPLPLLWPYPQHCGALCCHVVPGCVVCTGVKAMVAPGHDGALLCLLSPISCVLLWLLLLTLQLFFYTWRSPVSPASQVCSSCVTGFTSSFKCCVGPPLLAWRNPVSGTVDGQNPAPPHHFTLEGSHSNPRAPSEEVVQDFGPSTCFCFLTVVAPMLTRENEGSKKSVRKVVQDFVHQQ